MAGVVKDLPANSSFRSLSLVPLDALEGMGWNNDIWESGNCQTFVHLDEEANLEAFKSQILDVYAKNAPNWEKSKPTLRPITKIHLYDLNGGGLIVYVAVFSGLAVLVLLLAMVNTTNLATARSAGRAQEVGVRKVVGADRRRLIGQFLSESLLLAALSLALAVALARLLLPVFGILTGKALSLDIADLLFVLGALALALVAGLASGNYPAFFLSAFRPVNVLKGSLRSSGANVLLRRLLVVFQFGVSIVFIIGTAVVYQQIRYIRTKPVGFVKENVIVLPFGDPRARPLFQSFKDRLLQSPLILSASGASSLPGGLVNVGLVAAEGAGAGEQTAVDFNLVGYDFLGTLGIELAAGRDFSRDHPSDLQQAVILNEAVVRLFGWTDHPLEHTLRFGNQRVQVIGVVKDFHTRSLRQRVGPLVLHLSPTPDGLLYAAVRVNPREPRRALEFIEAQWR